MSYTSYMLIPHQGISAFQNSNSLQNPNIAARLIKLTKSPLTLFTPYIPKQACIKMLPFELKKSDFVHTDDLLDSGSKTNFVLQKLVKQLNLPTPTMTSISQKLLTVDVMILTFAILDLGRQGLFLRLSV